MFSSQKSGSGKFPFALPIIWPAREVRQREDSDWECVPDRENRQTVRPIHGRAATALISTRNSSRTRPLTTSKVLGG